MIEAIHQPSLTEEDLPEPAEVVEIGFEAPAEAVEATPITSGDRVHLIDSLRGLAIFGILTMNMAWFAWPPVRNFGAYIVSYANAMDQGVDMAFRFFAQGKFYIIFSFLFGLGMAVQKERLEAAGRRFVSFFATRMFWLMLIGLAHGFFIWSGDILFLYALMGFVLLLFRNRKPRGLLIWAFCLLALFVVPMTIKVAMDFSGSPDVSRELSRAHQAQRFGEIAYNRALVIYQHGTYGEIFAQRKGEFLRLMGSLPVVGTMVLISFLFGAWAWQVGIFTDFKRRGNLIKRVFLYSGALGLVSNGVFIFVGDLHLPGAEGMLGMLGMVIAQYAMAYAYLAGLAWLYHSGRMRGLFTMLAPVGRMALSNYLFHSVFFTLVFNSYGLGLMGRIGETTAMLSVLAVFLIQVMYSHWWLGRYRFGPLEWLWRSLTYGKLQNMRRRVEVAPPPAVS